MNLPIAILLMFCMSAGAITQTQVIALTIALEGSTQGIAGRHHIASSIYNRAESLDVKELASVCLKPKQYSCWNGRKPNIRLVKEFCRTESGLAIFDECMKLAQSMSKGTFRPIVGVTHYHVINIRPQWSNSYERIRRHGKHIFYRES